MFFLAAGGLIPDRSISVSRCRPASGRLSLELPPPSLVAVCGNGRTRSPGMLSDNYNRIISDSLPFYPTRADYDAKV